MRGGTYQEINGVTLAGISIHPPRAGWDGKSWPYRARTWNFNPPTPCGVGRLAIAPDQGRGVEFQSTHPVRGGTAVKIATTDYNLISIHPPRAGWDPDRRPQAWEGGISIHPPRAGWDDYLFAKDDAADPFQSTHPVRGGTVFMYLSELTSLFQSTHPVRGGTMHAADARRGIGISIHPTRAGWDSDHSCGLPKLRDFNPPTPCGVGLRRRSRADPLHPISIHPPRAGWDAYSEQLLPVTMKFQSTHPVRGGT